MMIPTNSTNSSRRSRRRPSIELAIALLVPGALLVLVVLGLATAFVVRDRFDPGEPVTGVTEVIVRDNSFSPDAIEVPVGTTVTWRWEGDHEHNVVGDGFESPTQDEGEFSYTFSEPGTYDYRCTLHFLMRGEVVVTEAPTS